MNFIKPTHSSCLSLGGDVTVVGSVRARHRLVTVAPPGVKQAHYKLFTSQVKNNLHII